MNVPEVKPIELTPEEELVCASRWKRNCRAVVRILVTLPALY